MIPWGWAIAYRDFNLEAKAAYPIFVHFLVRWERDFLYWLMKAGRPGYRERVEQAAFRKGLAQERGVTERLEAYARERGYTEGHDAGWSKCQATILQRFDEYVIEKRKDIA